LIDYGDIELLVRLLTGRVLKSVRHVPFAFILALT
jgi:hypothetical protein